MNQIKDIFKIILAALLLGATVAMAAFDPVNDDTDIFLANPNITAERPNVLIILDNTANWNQPFTNEKNALVQVVNGLTDQFNVGLMMMVETGGGNDNIDGGYVRYHVRQMNSANKSALASMVNNLHILNDKGNNNTAGLALYEAYLYYGGLASSASFGKVKTDKDNTTDPLLTPLTGHALPASPTSSSLYRSPVTDGCARNFIIYISNGAVNENASARSFTEGKLATLTGVTPPSVLSITPNGQQGNWGDEMAKFMANADVVATNAGIPNSAGVQNVYTYTVEVDPATTGQGPDTTALFKSIAANGKGKYFGVTSGASGTAIVDALNAIFTEVQAVNSVFASTTLPVSVNVRGTNLNQVYIGVFRPDANKAPRWLGNLKMYNLALNASTNTVFLADAANGLPPAVGNAAENTTTGFVSQTSPSFWTTDSTFWGFRDPSQNGPGGPSDKPDGDLVEKGGAAQQLRLAFAAAEASTPARKLYTCTTGLVNGVNQDCVPTAGFSLSNTPFSTLNDAISPAALQLDTRFVDPLTAYTTQPVTSITDRLPVQLTNTWFGYYVTSISNAANTKIISNLTTAVPKVVTGLSGTVPNTQVVAVSSIAKVSGNIVVTAAAALPAIFANGVTVTIAGTSNGALNANWTISNINTAAKTFEINAPNSSSASTGGSATVTSGTIGSTTATATLASHGYVSGQSVTIAGASPAQFNGTYNITVLDTDHFTYTMSLAGTTATGSPTITASGNTTIATATTSAAHNFLQGTSVNIVGASNAAYNGAKTIIDCLPAVSCVGATTFRYSVGATAVGPNTNASGVTATQGGGTTVTVTIHPAYYPHYFANGQTVYISGSDVPGYNGAFTISCPGCDAVNGSSATFTITTASVLPANTSTQVYVSDSVSDYVLGFAPNHGLVPGEFVTIEGPAPHAGTFQIIDNFGTDYYFYYLNAGQPAVTQNTYTARSNVNHKAYVTLPNHGYTNGQQLRIDGAVPTGYNGEPKTIRVCQTVPSVFYCYNELNMFSYPLTAPLGANSSTTVTASVKSTLARATSINHGFANGSSVTVAGATPGAFNGTFTITTVDADHFNYTIASAQGDATGAISAAQASGSSVERDLIIRWTRGEDNFQDENVNTSTTDIRASVHGDVLHSRPAVVNYNRFAGSDDDVFVYYGGNDGIFHAVKGGYTVPTGDVSGLTPGREAWGFVPQEFFSQFRRMRNNSPVVSSAFKKPYFMDGPIGTLALDNNNNGKLGDVGDTVNLYVANRRGGRFLYALDVNNPTDPKFLWKITNATTGFSELGQTWSQPTVVTGLGGLTTPMLVIGGGYDPAAEDLDPAVVTGVNTTTGAISTSTVGTVNRTMGRGIYVVNALTGALIWSAGNTGSGATTEVPGMIYAIPSDVTVIKNLSGGPTNRAYVGDTGGNMWRIDFKHDSSAAAVAVDPDNLALTTVTKLASIANQSTAAGRRKFLFPPDVVGQTGFDAVLIGSGDREHPFDTTVTNRFYMFKDKGNDVAPATGTTTCDPTITEGSITDAADACAPNPGDIPGMSDLTSNCIQDAAACAAAGEVQATVTAKLGTDRGWYITLLAGEKVVGNAISIGGTTFFNTNQPSATAGGGTCGSNLGVARQYQVATADATSTSDLNAVGGLTGADRSLIHAGGGYLPSPVHVVVMLGGKPVEAVISGIQVSTPAGASLSARLRKFWYKEVDTK